MMCEVAEEVVSEPELKSVVSLVILYPIPGAGDGAVQETNTLLIPFCLTVRLVGALPVSIFILLHVFLSKDGCYSYT